MDVSRLIEVILRFCDHVDAIEDWCDVACKVDAVVAREVKDIPFPERVVLTKVPRREHVVEIDGNQALRLVLMNEVDFFLGRVAREALGRTDGVDNAVRFLELDGAGLISQSN